MVRGVWSCSSLCWYLAGPLAPPSVWKGATAPTLARLGAPGGSPRHRRGSPSLRGLSDPCPPSARAVPVLSSPSLPTSAHPVLAPTTTTAYHPPYPGGQFLSEFLPTQSALPGQAHRTEGLEPILITHPTRRRGVWCPYLNAQPPIYNPHSRSPDQEVPLHRSYDSGSGARRRIAPCSTEWYMCSVRCKNIKELSMMDIC